MSQLGRNPPKLPPMRLGESLQKPDVAREDADGKNNGLIGNAIAGLMPRLESLKGLILSQQSEGKAASQDSQLHSATLPQEIANTAEDIALEGLPENMGSMVEAIHIYDRLLIEENIKLKNGDSNGVAELLDRKVSATRIYQERLQMVLSDESCTRSLSPDQRSNIIAKVKNLEARAKENMILLKANMGAIEQVFEVINTAARKMRQREVSYSQNGKICDAHSSHNVSLAFNQSI